ncbi:FAD-binding domain-containing protein, partial [Glonium stellatum]
HTPFAGLANIQHSITTDLSQLSEITVSEDRTTTTIDTGNLWGAVNHKLDPLGVSTPGGRISSVGVSNLVSGGGMSFYSPCVGLVCDAVLNFEAILSSGSIVNANVTHNFDLFRALKGASNNLGIMTRIDLPLIPSGTIWGGFLAISTTYSPQIFLFFTNFTNSSNYDPYAAVIDTKIFSNGSWYTLLHMAYTKPNVINPPTFAPLIVFMEALFQLANTIALSITSVPNLMFDLSF